MNKEIEALTPEAVLEQEVNINKELKLPNQTQSGTLVNINDTSTQEEIENILPKFYKEILEL